MFCSKCGKQAEGEFCWNCGAKLFNPETSAASNSNEIKDTVNEVAKPEICKKPVSFSKFKATRQYTNIQFDDIHQIIAVSKSKDIDYGDSSVTYLRYSEILNAEVKCTYENVSKSSTGSVIGRAAVGSLISPGAAIIGGATAKKVEKQHIDTLAVHITTSNVRYPLVIINYTSGMYYNEAETICGVLLQVKLMPPTEDAFELTQKWGAGTAPIKADAVPAVKPVKPKNVEVTSEPWRCSVCDYKNPPASSVCLNCSASKYKTSEKGTHLSEAAQEASAREIWYCPECDYKNNGGKSCRNCGEIRPEPKDKSPKKLFGNLLKK